jgi:hypothetical protein
MDGRSLATSGGCISEMLACRDACGVDSPLLGEATDSDESWSSAAGLGSSKSIVSSLCGRIGIFGAAVV